MGRAEAVIEAQTQHLPFIPSSPHPLIALLCALLIGAAIAPTLAWQEFSSSMEALNVATAQEIRRTNNWLIPTLQGDTRLQKPPLSAWITAAAMNGKTMREISSPDSGTRDRGFTRLAWIVRGEALLLSCGTLLVVFQIGRLLFDAQVGLISVLVMGASLLFLRFARYATTDVPLTFFVTATNLFCLVALLKGRWWLGFVGGGLALALAMLTKGPVALLETVVPIAAYLGLSSKSNGSTRLRWTPLLVGFILFLLAGLAWYVLVFLREPNAWQIWKDELARVKDPESHRNPWYRYLLLLPYLAPWSVFFVVGIVVAFRRRDARDVLLLLLVFLPLLVMCFFPDRHERYMLPLLPAAAIITARSIMEFRNVRWIAQLHWLVVAALGVAFPIVAALLLKRLDARAWISSPIALVAALISAIIIGFCFARRTSAALLLGSAIIMLTTQYLFMAGYSQTRQGVAEFRPIAEQIWSSSPDAEVFNAHPRGKRPPPEIGVYLNRTLWHVDDPSQLQPGARDKVLLMLQDKRQPPPTPPPGWSKIAEKTSDGEGWHAFLLPGTHRLTSTTHPR